MSGIAGPRINDIGKRRNSNEKKSISLLKNKIVFCIFILTNFDDISLNLNLEQKKSANEISAL